MILNVDPQLSQWDVDRIVVVSDTEATHMHFANPGDSKAVIMEIVGGEVQIPNYLLQTGKSVIAYAVLDGVTVGSKTFPVRKRERPENYVYEEDRRNYIYELIADTEAAADRANDATNRMIDHVFDDGNPHNVTTEKIGAVSLEKYNTFVDNVTSHITSVEDNLTAHSDRKDNPHGVTAAQVGAVAEEDLAVKMADILEEEAQSGGLVDEQIWLRATDVAIYEAEDALQRYNLVSYDVDSDATLSHADDTNNPHNVTCKQIGAVTQKEFQEVLDNLEIPDDGNSGQLIPHITNRDNPHEVTAEQVGAVPIDDLVSHVIDILNDQEVLDHIGNTDNPHGVTAAQAGAAPAGYGLGEELSNLTPWYNITKNGFYSAVSGSPDSSRWMGLNINGRSKSESSQLAFRDLNDIMVEAIRMRSSQKGWNEWEYVNPPMLEGVEYRTTERFNGMPVYVKLINGGLLTNNTSKFVTLSEETVNVIELKGFLQRSGESGYFPLPRFSVGGSLSAFVYAAYVNNAQTVANVISTEDMSNYTVFLSVKYTKAT